MGGSLTVAAKKRKKINLALQGGGAHGAVAWGVLDRLLEDDRLEIEAISGTSAGAVNAAALAYGIHVDGRDGARQALDNLWAEINRAGRALNPFVGIGVGRVFGVDEHRANITYQAFEGFTRLLSPYQFNPFNFNPLRRVLEKVIDFDALSRCTAVSLYVSATNVRTGKIHIFPTDEVTLDAICASACLPFVFKAVEIDGEHFWDGGYMGNPALFPFFYEGESSDIVIVHINPIERDQLPTTAPDIFNRINEISFNSSLLRELRAINFVHKLIEQGWLREGRESDLENVRIHSIRSDRALAEFSVASKFSIEWTFLNELKAQGRAVAGAWLEENFDQIGRKSSVDLRAMFD